MLANMQHLQTRLRIIGGGHIYPSLKVVNLKAATFAHRKAGKLWREERDNVICFHQEDDEVARGLLGDTHEITGTFSKYIFPVDIPNIIHRAVRWRGLCEEERALEYRHQELNNLPVLISSE